MKGDFSRIAFRPESSYTAVLMQQGRVRVDADWNEAVMIEDRRRRTMLVDLVGRCAVSRLTPDAFRIVREGASFTIGPGRFYADGLVAECFGQGEREMDPVLGEQRGRDPIPYEQQPFLPEPDPVAGSHGLVYLDVWQRTVTSSEDPDLNDPGPETDTTLRAQTVWQVRLLPNVGDPQHDLDLVDAPTGRLSCRQGKAGYRGHENRLYRVEIHDGGPVGGATFKWSRDNGSTIASVIDVARDLRTLVLGTLPNDIPLKRGDLLEAMDERHELGNRPGLFVEVKEWRPPRAALVEPLPRDALDPRFAPRVRRWEGLAPAGRKAVELEEGIEVAFGGSDFRTGDYWTFRARAATHTIEQLDDAPPQGIHHHRCALALVPARGAIRDLRPRRSA